MTTFTKLTMQERTKPTVNKKNGSKAEVIKEKRQVLQNYQTYNTSENKTYIQ